MRCGGQCLPPPLLPFSFLGPTLDGMAARREAAPHLLSHVRGREQQYLAPRVCCFTSQASSAGTSGYGALDKGLAAPPWRYPSSGPQLQIPRCLGI